MIADLSAVGQKSIVQEECGSFFISSMDKKQSTRGKGQGKISLRLLPNDLIPPLNSHILKIFEYPNSATIWGLSICNLSLQEAFYI